MPTRKAKGSSKKGKSSGKMSKKEEREETAEKVKGATAETLQRVVGGQGPKVAAAIGIAIGLQKHAIPLFDMILQANLGFSGLLDIEGAGSPAEALELPVTRIPRTVLEETTGTDLPGPDEVFISWFTDPFKLIGDGLNKTVVRRKTEKADVLTKIPAEDTERREKAEKSLDAQLERDIRAVFTRAQFEDALISFGAAWFLLTLAEEKTTTEIVNNIAEALPL